VAATLLSAAALLAGCSSGPPPRGPAAGGTAAAVLSAEQLAAIPDAVPRVEPRSRLGNPPFYEALGQRYFVMATAEGYKERGVASWYGPGFHAERTSNGDAYDMYAMTAAHKSLPLPSYVRVTNLANGRSVVLRVNDRGPFVANRIIDLSYTAAWKLDMLRAGTAFVEVEALVPGSLATTSAAVADVPAAPAALSSRRLYVQVGAFGVEANARALHQRLQGAGFPAALLLPPNGGSPLWRVRIGPLDDAAAFDRHVAALTALGLQGRLTTD
jgi:rare lipoprotein A